MLEDRDKLTRYEQVKYFIQTKIKNGEYKIGEILL